MSTPYHWQHPITVYHQDDLRVLTFPTLKGLHRLIDLLWVDPDLRGLPRSYGGGRTMIVPADAVDLLRTKGLKFRVGKCEYVSSPRH